MSHNTFGHLFRVTTWRESHEPALGESGTIRAALVQIGPHQVDRGRWDWDETLRNPFWCPDAEMAPVWEKHLEATRKAGSSTGAVIEVEAAGVPAGWGAPIYGKL